MPLVEPVHDPRNFYTSDSPVIEDPDSDQDLYKSAEEDVENVELDGQGDGVADSSNSGSNVCFFFFVAFTVANRSGVASITWAIPTVISTPHCPRFPSSIVVGLTPAAPGFFGTPSKFR